MKTILVIDDERNIVELLRLYLEKEGWAVIAAGDGETGARAPPPARSRPHRPRPDAPADRRLRGLPRGPPAGRHADPHADRPRRRRRLDRRPRARRRRLRHEAVQPAGPRRPGQGDPAPDVEATARGGRPIEVGGLRIDPRRREATSGSAASSSGSREFDLLAALARDPGVVLTRDALLEDVWGTDFPGETRTVDVHVAEVRRKLGDDGPRIETVRGLGYRLLQPVREGVPGRDVDHPPGGSGSDGSGPGAGSSKAG